MKLNKYIGSGSGDLSNGFSGGISPDWDVIGYGYGCTNQGVGSGITREMIGGGSGNIAQEEDWGCFG